MRQDTGPSANSASATFRVAARLRRKALEVENGGFLGSEDTLIASMNVSRPTFRQAARLLVAEQLITIRRGVGGGFFARRPTLDAVSQAVATYLWSRQTSVRQVAQANSGLMYMAMELATASDDASARKRLQGFAEQLGRHSVETITWNQLQALGTEFKTIIGELCGNPAIELCLTMFEQFGFGASQVDDGLFSGHPERMQAWFEVLVQCVNALLTQDMEATRAAFKHRSALLAEWLGSSLDASPGSLFPAAGDKITPRTP